MFLQIDSTDGLPIYLQIIQQVKHAIASGALAASDRLPSVRELAVQLRVNPNTVARAYQELERQGIVEFRRGNGTFVSDTAPDMTLRQKRDVITAHLDRLLVEAHHLGLSLEELHKLLNDREHALSKQRKAGGK